MPDAEFPVDTETATTTFRVSRKKSSPMDLLMWRALDWAAAWDQTHGKTFTGGEGSELIAQRDRAEAALREAVALLMAGGS